MRTYVGWPARSVRSLRYHGTVLCLADSAPNFTASRFLVARARPATCYSAPNICSSLPWWQLSCERLKDEMILAHPHQLLHSTQGKFGYLCPREA